MALLSVILRSRQLFHTTYKMYIASLSLEVLHLFFMCIAYGKYANDGKDNYSLKTFSESFLVLYCFLFVCTYYLFIYLLSSIRCIFIYFIYLIPSMKRFYRLVIYIYIYYVFFTLHSKKNVQRFYKHTTVQVFTAQANVFHSQIDTNCKYPGSPKTT